MAGCYNVRRIDWPRIDWPRIDWPRWDRDFDTCFWWDVAPQSILRHRMSVFRDLGGMGV